MDTQVPRGGLMLIGALSLGVLTGCGGGDRPTRPLTAEAFEAPSTPEGMGADNPVDRPGQVVYAPGDPALAPPVPPGQAAPPVREPGPTVRELVQTPAEAATRPASSGDPIPNGGRPNGVATTTRPAAPGDRYWELGSVIMEVNGQPIFTDTILRDLEKLLSVDAKRLGPDEFRRHAAQRIQQQVELHHRDELEFASADRELGEEDKAMARAMTIGWRQQQITNAGGSLEVARQKAAADNQDFDELVRSQYRKHLIQIFYRKRVIPRIFIPAQAIRNYYEQNKAKEFTQHAAARFRAIKINPKETPTGTKEEAFQKATQIAEQAKTENFAELAARVNDDPAWKSASGDVGWYDKDAFRFSEVEKTVYTLKPGQVSGVISDENLYFVVKLEELKEGKVQAFEEQAVQERIRERLRGEQFEALRRQHVAKLQADAVTRQNPGMLQATLDIVMRRYPQWAMK